MINAIEWFKEKGFTFDDKITIKDVIVLQDDARKDLLIKIKSLERGLEACKNYAVCNCPDAPHYHYNCQRKLMPIIDKALSTTKKPEKK